MIAHRKIIKLNIKSKEKFLKSFSLNLFQNRSEQGLRVPSHRSLLDVNEDGEGRA